MIIAFPQVINLNDVLFKQNLQQSINILLNSIASASTLQPYDDVILDIITDADGNDNTIDTGNTTATFDTNKYTGVSSVSDETDATVYTQGGTTPTLKKTFSNIDSYVEKVTFNGQAISNGNGVYCKMVFVYDDATSEEVNSSFGYASGYTAETRINPSPEKLVDYIEMWMWTATGVNTAYVKDQVIYDFNSVDVLVQTDPQSITENPVGYQLFCHKTLIGDGTVTYDVSFDGGTTWATDNELDAIYTNSMTGSSMMLKININGVGYHSAEIEDYALMMQY